MQPIDDPQLKKLLREWSVEDAPYSLDGRVFGTKQSWWKLLFGGSVRVPVPVVLGFAVLLPAMGAALVRSRPSPASAAPTVSSTINLAEFQPVRDVRVRIMRAAMRMSSLLSLALLPAFAMAQEGSVTVGNRAWGGLIVRFLPKLEPPGTALTQLTGGVIPTSDGTHRVINDAVHKRQFGYDLHANLKGDGQTLQLTLGPLTQGRGSFKVNAGWTLITPPSFPAVPVMRAGDVAAIDLLVNPATGQKVVEYLSVERADLEPTRIAKMPPRDFALDDVELDRPQAFANGKLLESMADSLGGIRAHMVWLFLPGEGTFVVSLHPEPGHNFVKAGMHQGSTMTFRNGSSEYRVECASPIAPGSGVYNVYLHFEPRSPKGDSSEFTIGGADKGAWLVRKE